MSKSIAGIGATLAVAGFGFVAGAARAETYSWNWSPSDGDSTTGSGAFDESGGVITSFTGTFGGEAITALLPVNSYYGNDNEYPLNSGVAFSIAAPYQGGTDFVLYSGAWFNDNTVGYGTFTASPAVAVPEPATCTLIGAGVAGLIGARRRRRKAAALAAA